MGDLVLLVVQGWIIRHAEPDGLGLIPVSRAKRQRGTQIHVCSAACRRDHDIRRGLAAQAHGVAVAVGTHRHVAEILSVQKQAVAIILDGHPNRSCRGNTGIVCDRMGQRDVLVGPVVVFQRGHDDGLRRVPGAGGTGRERERGGRTRCALPGLHGDGIPVRSGNRYGQSRRLTRIGGEFDVVAPGLSAFFERDRHVVGQYSRRCLAIVIDHRNGCLVFGIIQGQAIGVMPVLLLKQGGDHGTVLFPGLVVQGGHRDPCRQVIAGEFDRPHSDMLRCHEVAALPDAQPYLRWPGVA